MDDYFVLHTNQEAEILTPSETAIRQSKADAIVKLDAMIHLEKKRIEKEESLGVTNQPEQNERKRMLAQVMAVFENE